MARPFLTDNDVTKLVAEAFRQAKPPHNVTDWQARKAEIYDVSLTTFENWHYGRSVPEGASLARLMRDPDIGPRLVPLLVGDAVRESTDDELHDTIDRANAELRRRAQRRARTAAAA